MGSSWVESLMMTWLAGYLVEDQVSVEVRPEWLAARRRPTADHMRVAQLLHTVSRSDPLAAASHVRTVRRKTLHLLSRPGVAAKVIDVATGLVAQRRMSGPEFYERFFNSQCSALNPQLPEVSCESRPHPFSYHLADNPAYDPAVPDSERHLTFDGLDMPDSRIRLSHLPGSVKRVWALNRGGPLSRLPKSWDAVLTACDDLDDDWNISEFDGASQFVDE